MFDRSDTRIVIPVRNGGARWREAAAQLRQSVADPARVVVVDSSSTDGSDGVAADNGFELDRIDVRTFNHGRTRQQAVERFCRGCRFVVFLTQDAVVESHETLSRLLASFEDSAVGAAYGRQLPHEGAQPFEAHAALFNYRDTSETRSLQDAARLGIKAAFLSNSFAAYRVSALLECGGFPDHLIAGEDVYVAMQMLVAGWRIRYCADAPVRHSHACTIRQDTQRYFDWGVMHAQIPELLARFGQPEGEGLRFVLSELRYVGRVRPVLLPEVPVRNAAKYAAYRLGRIFTRLPRGWPERLSMTKGYWRTAGQEAGPVSR